MVNLTELKPGMRVKIVAEPPKGSAFEICKDPHQTEMGQHLNKVVTITDFNFKIAKITRVSC